MMHFAFKKKPEKYKGPCTLLAGDLGASKTYLALSRLDESGIHTIGEAHYLSRDFSHFFDMVDHFLKNHPRPDRICFGVAGPVLKGKVKGVNIPWEIDSRVLRKQTGVRKISLINDLEATAWGLAALKEYDFLVLHPGDKEAEGNMAVIAPGTGLGEAGLYFDRRGLHPFAGEGGHSDFAPRSDMDIELFRKARELFGHVSWERLVSGPGISLIYQFLRDDQKMEEPLSLKKEMEEGDGPAVISSRAMEPGQDLCRETMLMFIRILAHESANLVLKFKATGGIFIGGGIVPKIRNLLKPEFFIPFFFDSGRLKSLLQNVPVKVVLNDKTALTGATWYGFYNA